MDFSAVVCPNRGVAWNFSLSHQVLSCGSPLTSNTQPQSHINSSFIPRTQLSVCLFMNWSVISPQELSSIKFEINNTHGQELSTKWTLPHYFHKPPTPTCWLQISFSFRRARCSLPRGLRPPLRTRERAKGTYFGVHCQGYSTRIQKPGNSTLGKDSRSLPARFTSHHGRLFVIVLWRGFPSCLKLCPPTQGRFCWTPGAVVASSLLSIMSRETSEKNFYFPLSLPVTIPNWLLRAGWWPRCFPLQASHCDSLIVSKYP